MSKQMTKVAPAYRRLSDEDKKKFYKLLITHNYTEAAVQVGMDAHYQGSALRTAGYQIYQDIIKNGGGESLGLEKDLVDMVEAAIEARKVFKGKPISQEVKELEFTPSELLDPNDTKQIIVGGRNKAAMLLHKKFDMINKNKKALAETSLSQLGTVFGILFDKSQILQGQATENISVMSKNIKSDMTPEESLEMILRMREQNSLEKE